MQRCISAALMVLTCAAVVRSQGIAARSTAETLRGLHGVHVVVEEVIPTVRSSGLTAAVIKSTVEDHMVKRGVPVLGLGEVTMDPRGPTLLIQIDFVAAEPIYFYNSQVQFFQNVTVDMGDGELPSYVAASTWQTNLVDKAGRFRLPTLTQVVVKQVDKFVDAYLTMNPPAPEPESAEADSTAEGEMSAESAEQ